MTSIVLVPSCFFHLLCGGTRLVGWRSCVGASEAPLHAGGHHLRWRPDVASSRFWFLHFFFFIHRCLILMSDWLINTAPSLQQAANKKGMRLMCSCPFSTRYRQTPLWERGLRNISHAWGYASAWEPIAYTTSESINAQSSHYKFGEFRFGTVLPCFSCIFRHMVSRRNSGAKIRIFFELVFFFSRQW